MEEGNKMEVIEELQNEDTDQRNGDDGLDVVAPSEKEKAQNGGGDSGESVKIKSKVSPIVVS